MLSIRTIVIGAVFFAAIASTYSTKRKVLKGTHTLEKELFDLHDKNGDKEISLDELASFIQEGDGMTREKLQELINIFDINQNGTLSFEEFLPFVAG